MSGTITVLPFIALGIVYTAVRQYSWIDHFVTMFSFVGYSVPPFWSGLLAIIRFSVMFKQWGLPSLPATGMFTLGSDSGLLDRLAHLVLPVGVLALFNAAHYTRYVRSSPSSPTTCRCSSPAPSSPRASSPGPAWAASSSSRPSASTTPS